MSRAADWWRLPGPYAGLERLWERLHDGVSAVVRVPECLRQDFGRCFVTHAQMHQRSVREVYAGDSRTPAEILAEDLGCERDDELAEASSPFEQYVLIDGVPEYRWDAWHRFLELYEQRARGVESVRRRVVVVVAPNRAWRVMPPKAPVLDLCDLGGTAHPTEAVAFAQHLAHRRGACALETDLLAAIAAALAPNDPYGIDRLTNLDELDDRALLDLLRSLAETYEWKPEAERETRLARGSLFEFPDGERIHGAELVIDAKVDQIWAAIWRAQVGVLLPYVEEQRRFAAGRLKGYLSHVPDLHDLEIGELHRECDHRAGIHPPLKRSVAKLRDWRNALAHQERIPLSEIAEIQRLWI